MDHEGMSRRHANYKIVSLVLGNNGSQEVSVFRRPNASRQMPGIGSSCRRRNRRRGIAAQ
jgi:hypothetical protein